MPNPQAPSPETLPKLSGDSLEAWNDAYRKVESYLTLLGVKNRLLLGQKVFQILEHARERAVKEPARVPMELAVEETVRLINQWCWDVMKVDPSDQPHRVSTRGRLALLLADLAGQWQEHFLTPGPWPEGLVKAMRENYLRAGPEFQLAEMEPRPIDLGPIATLTTLGRRPYLKMLLVWLAFILAFVIVFQMTH